MHPLVNIAISAAREAGGIIVRHANQLDRINIREKDINDIVSDVDIKAEQAIIHTLQKAYPNHSILAEECGYKKNQDDDYTWIIDPLDGTSNYVHGFPHYCVSIALKHKSRIEHAVIFDPIRKECFSASRGAGAQLNGTRIRVSSAKAFNKSLLGTGFPFKNKAFSEEYFSYFKTLFSQCAGIRRAGAAALDLAYVAAGRLDGFWEFGLKPWDVAAGSLLIKEAGGLVTDTSGEENYLKTGNVIAANPKIFRTLLTSLKSIPNK